MNRRIDTVLLDLDGTLLDTHRDLCSALNVVLERHGRQPLPSDTMRPFVSRGAMVMVCLAFKCQPGSDEARGYWQEMLDAYEENIAATTVLFPGMEIVLDKIESTGRNWGIVTNKPGYFTEKLLAQLELPWKPQSVVSGDTLTVKNIETGEKAASLPVPLGAYKWSPLGDAVYYLEPEEIGDNTGRLLRVDLETKQKSEVLGPLLYDFWLSPDASHIAVVTATEETELRIYRLR